MERRCITGFLKQKERIQGTFSVNKEVMGNPAI